MKKKILILLVPILALIAYTNCLSENYVNKNLDLIGLASISNANAEFSNEYQVPCQINVKLGGTWNIRICSSCHWVENGRINPTDNSMCVPK